MKPLAYDIFKIFLSKQALSSHNAYLNKNILKIYIMSKDTSKTLYII